MLATTRTLSPFPGFQSDATKVKFRSITFCLATLLTLASSSLVAQNPVPGSSKYWVFFKDKATSTLAKRADQVALAKSGLSPRALKRRAKVRDVDNLVDERDFPTGLDYLTKLRSGGHEPLVVSKWLNAASFALTESEVLKIEKLPFVKQVRRVARARRGPDRPVSAPKSGKSLQRTDDNAFDYGSSLSQNDRINVPAVHNLSITGKGVWIGMLDSGFKTSDHDAFQALEVVAERDFVYNDNVTENEAVDHPDQHNHGTRTLSVVGGFKTGELIGTAFGASFLLAKTEDVTQEVPQEEDNWVAGIEWFESQGVDVVSSSLGYPDFYSMADMDGNTAVVTIAADVAVSLGVVVVNSAGNQDPWPIVIPPADGDSVIAVGGVTSAGNLSSFSSVGPTADGRVKPDVVALATSAYTAGPSSSKSPSPFALVSGTSFSAPAVAGVAALILSAHPNLTPIQVRDALRSTADRAANPDNEFGWGIVDALKALLFHGTVFSNSPQVSVNNSGQAEISTKLASRVGVDPAKVQVIYSISNKNLDKTVAMSQGTENNQFVVTIPEALGNQVIHYYFSGVDSSGVVAFNPFSAPDSSFSFSQFPVSVVDEPGEIPTSFTLAQNYPNPFNPTTKIDFELSENSRVSLTVFNVLGQNVRSLLEETTLPAGKFNVTWDGKDDSGELTPTGVYYYQLKANDFVAVKKMLFLR